MNGSVRHGVRLWMASWIALGCANGTSSDEAASASSAGGGATSASGNGGSGGAGICDPGLPPTCDGASAVKTCRADGTGYQSTPCPSGTTCADGVCGPSSCPPGTAFVQGQCDDLRCPDETGVPGSVSLPLNAWPRFRHDNRNSGWTRAKVPDQPALQWKAFVGFGVGPVVDPTSKIFAGAEALDGSTGAFVSFDAATQSNIYSFDLGPKAWDVTVPAVRNDGTAYFSTSNTQTGAGVLYAVKPDGSALWSYDVPSVAEGHPIVAHDGTLVYASDDHSLYALDSNGSLLWKSDPATGPGEADSGLAESCDGQIYVGGSNGWASVDITTGENNWLVPVPTLMPLQPQGAVTSSPVVAADGTLYGIDDQGVGWAIDASGNVLWTKPLASGPAGTRISSAKLGEMLLVISGGSLLAVDTKTGNQLWQQGAGLMGGPVIDGNLRIYVNSGGGTLYAFDASGAQLWQLGTGGSGMGELAIGPDGTLYAQQVDGYVYAVH